MALTLNNLKKSWYAIKQRNQTKPWSYYYLQMIIIILATVVEGDQKAPF